MIDTLQHQDANTLQELWDASILAALNARSKALKTPPIQKIDDLFQVVITPTDANNTEEEAQRCEKFQTRDILVLIAEKNALQDLTQEQANIISDQAAEIARLQALLAQRPAQ